MSDQINSTVYHFYKKLLKHMITVKSDNNAEKETLNKYSLCLMEELQTTVIIEIQKRK